MPSADAGPCRSAQEAGADDRAGAAALVDADVALQKMRDRMADVLAHGTAPLLVAVDKPIIYSKTCQEIFCVL